MSWHEHCRNCVISQCTYSHDCPVIPCQFGCEVKLHRCKMSDHGTICQSIRIPCINSHYGCPMNVIRSKLSSHLRDCPANVILCTMEWGRYPLYSEERLKWVPFKQRNPVLVKGCLDVELAVRDQKVINKIREKKNKRGLAKVVSERYDPNTKLSYERARRISQEIQAVHCLNESHENLKHESDRSQRKLQTLQLDYVETKALDSTVWEMNDGKIIPECPELLETHSGLGLNINLETIPKFLKHNFMYRVPCGQVLHRREFASHFKNVHSDIHGGLGWMEQRCPFAQYGCPFVMYRFRPSNQEASVVFSQHLGTFGVKPLQTTDCYPKDCHLLWLPYELLEIICQWLDGFSLCNLSLTCKTLHHHLFYLLPKRGIVVVKWKERIYEDGSTSWIIDQKCWKFTTAFSEVHRWVYSEMPCMSSHMERCPYYQQHTPEERFCYAENVYQTLSGRAT